jgi:hypothetical protein
LVRVRRPNGKLFRESTCTRGFFSPKHEIHDPAPASCGIEEQILLKGESESQAFFVALARYKSDALGDGIAWVPQRNWPSSENKTPARHATDPANGPTYEILSCTAQSRKGEDLTAHDTHRYRTNRANPDLASLQQCHARGWRGLQKHLSWRTTNYEQHQISWIGRADWRAMYLPSIAKNGHVIGKPEDLIESMTRVDHRDAMLPQAPKDFEQPRNVPSWETRRGLVQDDYLSLHSQRPGNCNNRLFGL